MQRHRKPEKTLFELTQEQREQLRALLHQKPGSMKVVAEISGTHPNNVTGWLGGRLKSRPIQDAVITVCEQIKQEADAYRERLTALVGEGQ